MAKILFNDLMDELNRLYPPILAEEWDQVGLHFGNPKAEVNKILTSLDIRESVVDEAIKHQIDTIIVHHPIIFQPIQRFNLSDPKTRIFEKLIKADIKVFAMHTNLDIAKNGMNDWLAEQLGLQNIRPLDKQSTAENPGLGRIGELRQSVNRAELLSLLKATYQRAELPVIEKEQKEYYQSIAIIGGSGTSCLDLVKEQQPDVFLTGDITYHTAQVCEELDFMTVDIGHYAENIFSQKTAEIIQELIDGNKWNITVQPSILNINPYKYE